MKIINSIERFSVSGGAYIANPTRGAEDLVIKIIRGQQPPLSDGEGTNAGGSRSNYSPVTESFGRSQGF